MIKDSLLRNNDFCRGIIYPKVYIVVHLTKSIEEAIPRANEENERRREGVALKNGERKMETEKVYFKLSLGRGYKEVIYQIETEGIAEGLRTPIKVRIVKEKPREVREE